MMLIKEIGGRYTPEMALAILITRVYLKRVAPEEIGVYIAQRNINWPLFEQIITAHQARPVMYKVLSVHNTGIPAPLLSALRDHCFMIAKSNLRNREELMRLHQMMKGGGVPNVPYKGVLLSLLLFHDYISRETSDIDFLIDRNDFAHAHELLINDGYKPRFYNPDFEQQFLNTSHEILYRKVTPAGPVKIELHWSATSEMMSIPLPNSHLLADLQTLQPSGVAVDVFGLEQHLLLVLVHHGVNDVWRSLRHCIDIALFLENYAGSIDWNKFQKAVCDYKIRHTTETGFLIAEQLFGSPIPPPFKTKDHVPAGILNNILRFPAIQKGKLNFENLRQQIFLRDSLKDKIALLWAYLLAGFTPNVRDMEAYTVPKNRYWLYYFIKPYRMLFRKGTK